MGIRSIVIVIGLAFAAPAAAQRGPARDRAMPHYRLGMEEMRSEQWEKAAADFQRAVDADPAFEMAWYELGRANMAGRRYAEAVAALAKCKGLYEAEAGKSFSTAQDAQQHRRDRITEIDEQIRQYQSAPPTIRTTEALRQLHETRRQLQDALQRGVAVSIEAAVPSFVSLALGSAYFRLGRLADAEREYKATIATDPKTGEAHSNLAVVYLQTGRFEEAEKAVKAAEKTGFKVNPALKEDIAAGRKGGK